MLRRYAALILAAGCLLTLGGIARAHRILADADYRLVRKVKVQSYFSDDTRPKGAIVQVFHPGEDTPLLEDHLDAKGELEFIADLQPLRVIVNAGEGHIKEVLIPAVDTAQGAVPDATTHIPSSEPAARQDLKDMFVGIGVLLGVAAFALSLLNYRTLRRLRQKDR